MTALNSNRKHERNEVNVGRGTPSLTDRVMLTMKPQPGRQLNRRITAIIELMQIVNLKEATAMLWLTFTRLAAAIQMTRHAALNERRGQRRLLRSHVGDPLRIHMARHTTRDDDTA